MLDSYIFVEQKLMFRMKKISKKIVVLTIQESGCHFINLRSVAPILAIQHPRK